LVSKETPLSKYKAPPPPKDVPLAAFRWKVLAVKLACVTVLAPIAPMYAPPPLAALRKQKKLMPQAFYDDLALKYCINCMFNPSSTLQ